MTEEATDQATAKPAPATTSGLPAQWPRGKVLRTSIDFPISDLHEELAPSAATGSIRIALDGRQIQSLAELTELVSEQLALPAFTTGNPEQVASAVDRRLFVMEKANEYLTVTLSNADSMPRPVFAYLVNWVTGTPIRLLISGDERDSEGSTRILQSLGIELLDISPSEASRDAKKPVAADALDADAAPSADAAAAAPTQSLEPTDTSAAALTIAEESTPQAAAQPNVVQQDAPREIDSIEPSPAAIEAAAAEEDLLSDNSADNSADVPADLELAVEPEEETSHRRWYLVAGATALTAAVLWYARTDAPAPTPTTASVATAPQTAEPATSAQNNTATRNGNRSQDQSLTLAEQVAKTRGLSSPAQPVTPAVGSATSALSDTQDSATTATDKLTEASAAVTADKTAAAALEPAKSEPAKPAPAKPTAAKVAAQAEPQTRQETKQEPQIKPEPKPVGQGGYTIQIASYGSVEVRAEYLRDMPNRPAELRAAEARAGGSLKNLLVYGTYPDYGSAARAIKDLPPALRKSQPFPIKANRLRPQ